MAHQNFCVIKLIEKHGYGLKEGFYNIMISYLIRFKALQGPPDNKQIRVYLNC